jgi:2-polyprenyl-3-methyl-5-hydroxy-6-metoxy-1,4-benzoquinol methylase
MQQILTSSKIVESESCPVCGTTKFEAKGSISPEVVVTVDGRAFKQPPGFIRECLFCGLLFRSPVLSEDELADYYRSVDFRKWEPNGMFPTEQATLRVLGSLPTQAKILDFGCSSGRLLSNLVNEYDCYGYEINEAAAAEAANKGVRILSTFALEQEYQQTFDAVVMVDVFEHLNNPFSVITRLFQLLKSKGILVIVTGNGDCLTCRRDPAHFWYFLCIEHLCMLTRKHANYLATKLGARLESWKEVCHYNHTSVEKLRQFSRHFAYWQFRQQTFLSRTLLQVTPLLRRAKDWPVAPAYTCTRDHVLLILRKPAISHI